MGKGRSICIYIPEPLLEKIKGSGKGSSRVVREALERYFADDGRSRMADEVVALLKRLEFRSP